MSTSPDTTSDARTTPLIGELTITASTGEVLTSRTDVGLAGLWAEAEVNANPELPDWSALRFAEQCEYTAEALAELRRAYGLATGE